PDLGGPGACGDGQPGRVPLAVGSDAVPPRDDPQVDQLLASFAVTVEEPARQGSGLVYGAPVGPLVEEDAGPALLALQQVPLDLRFAALGTARRHPQRRAPLRDSRLALRVLQIGLDDQTSAARAAAALALQFEIREGIGGVLGRVFWGRDQHGS